MEYQTGDIGFSSNKANRNPRTWISDIIQFLQTGKLKNSDTVFSHTFQFIYINGKLMVIDSDIDGVDVEDFEKFKKKRTVIKVFRPNVLTDLPAIQAYTELALSKSGNKYGWKSIPAFVLYLTGKRYLGQLTTPSDNMICSVFTAYLYNIKDWQIQTPQSLWVNRFKNFPKGEDI